MLEKILVCLDGSAAAERILPYVGDELLRVHSKVVLLRIAAPPETLVALNMPGSPGVPVRTESGIRRIETEEKEASDYLERMAKPLRAKGLNIENAVLLGEAGATIISYAQENKCTLIAMSTHGHGGLRRLAMGSTADFVLHHSPVPVLIVTAETKAP